MFIPFSPPLFLVLGSLGLVLLPGLQVNLVGVEGTWAYGFLLNCGFSGEPNSCLGIRGGHGVLLHICVLKSNIVQNRSGTTHNLHSFASGFLTLTCINYIKIPPLRRHKHEVCLESKP